jgi:predicted RNA-binding protein YlxR (DUF448 family)
MPPATPPIRTPKPIPQRMCVVCRTVAGKRTLTRLVRIDGEGVQIDPTGKRPGRGAYLCDQPACWRRAADSELINKALRTTLTIEERERLRMAIQPPPPESPSQR